MRRYLPGHVVQTAYELAWSTLKNGDLIAAADAGGFDVFVTTDQNLKYQQNLVTRRVGIVVLKSPSWPKILAHISLAAGAVDQALPGGYVEIVFP